ncbi:MAG: glutaredoxin family protein, partial [Microbacter sp.]
ENMFDFFKNKKNNLDSTNSQTQTVNQAHKVIIYSTSSCVWCNKLKQYLKQQKVKYKDYDVSLNLARRNEMVNLSGQMGVPVVVIDGQTIVGFDKKQIDKLLNYWICNFFVVNCLIVNAEFFCFFSF